MATGSAKIGTVGAQATAPAVKTVSLPTGVTLPYVEQGDPDGTPVVFLHGYTDSWRSWEPMLPHLPASFRVIAPTQRGHGDAERPAAGYGQRDFAADVAAFLDALGIESAVLVGTSTGATIAQHVALVFPERVRGLVLAGAFADYRSNPAIVEFWETGVSTLVDPIDPDFVREFQESTLVQPVPPGFLDTVVGESLKVPASVWRAVFVGCLDAVWSGELGRIGAPTLVVWGDQDLLCPRTDQDLLASAIADARLIVYEGAGHALHWEEPERFAADVVGFVQGLRA
jgi:non-heme chloroperoxidase